jgi:hypothetical protein
MALGPLTTPGTDKHNSPNIEAEIALGEADSRSLILGSLALRVDLMRWRMQTLKLVPSLKTIQSRKPDGSCQQEINEFGEAEIPPDRNRIIFRLFAEVVLCVRWHD